MSECLKIPKMNPKPKKMPKLPKKCPKLEIKNKKRGRFSLIEDANRHLQKLPKSCFSIQSGHPDREGGENKFLGFEKSTGYPFLK